MTEYEIKVYKIWYSDAPNDIYVGSTKHDRLSKRMKQHRSVATKGTSLIYRTMREKGANNFEYCMLGSCMVSNKDEQRMFEQTYIDRLKPTLNSMPAYSSYSVRLNQAIGHNKSIKCYRCKENFIDDHDYLIHKMNQHWEDKWIDQYIKDHPDCKIEKV